MIYNIIDKYDYSVNLLEYCLKMVLNTSTNETCFSNFSAAKFILKLIFISFIYQNNANIFTLIIKIFRVLANSDIVMNTFVKCTREYELTNKDFKFVNVIVEGTKTVLNVFPDIIMDISLFVAVLM